MKRGAQTAAAVIAGYLLGRTKKMRLALMIAAAGATGKHGTNPTGLLRAGLSRLSDSAELGKLTDSVRGELLDAARAAATKAATSRIESLSQKLTESSDGGASNDEAGEEQDSGEQSRRARTESAAESDAESAAESADEEPTERAEPTRRPGVRRRPRSATKEDDGSQPRGRRSTSEGNRRPTRRRPAASSAASDDSDTGDTGDTEDTDDRPRTRARASAGRSPVRRTGR